MDRSRLLQASYRNITDLVQGLTLFFWKEKKTRVFSGPADSASDNLGVFHSTCGLDLELFPLCNNSVANALENCEIFFSVEVVTCKYSGRKIAG